MGSPWIEDDEDEAWGETPSATGGPSGTPLPYVDPAVAAELAQDGPPAWMGTRWRDIEAEHQWEAWNTLRRWVDWFITEYRVSTTVIPPCWYRHSDVTAELYGAMCMEYKVWEEQAPGLGPMMMWHPHVEMLTGRLRRMVDEAGCTKVGQHKEPESFGGRYAFTLDYDEPDFTAWAGTTRLETTLDRPAEGVVYVRARVHNAQGEEVGVSNPVGVAARPLETKPEVSVKITSSGPGEPTVELVLLNVPNGSEVEWQTSADGHVWG